LNGSVTATEGTGLGATERVRDRAAEYFTGFLSDILEDDWEEEEEEEERIGRLVAEVPLLPAGAALSSKRSASASASATAAGVLGAGKEEMRPAAALVEDEWSEDEEAEPGSCLDDTWRPRVALHEA
jgi:hypothetical protein